MKNKHIAIIAENYPSKDRQVLVFVQELVHALIEQNVKVTIIAPQSIVHALIHRQGFLPKYSIGVTESMKTYDVYRPYTISAGNYRVFSKLVDFFNRWVVRTRVRKVNPDVLYAHFWSSALTIYKYALKYAIPLFVACGEGDDALEDMVNILSKEQIENLASAVTGVVSVSSENKRKCVKYRLATESDVQVFPNGVNTDIFFKTDVSELKNHLGVKDGDFVVGFVGGFIPRKGPDRIAEAIKKLNDPHIKSIFIGKPFAGYPYDFDCPGILHKGPVEHCLLSKYLNCMDVFVMPTLNEGCCNAIVEALAVGLPVISSDRPFNDDILNEQNSIRIDPNDIDAIAEALRIYRDNTKMRLVNSQYSILNREKYSIAHRAKNILDFIDIQLNKHKK